MKEKLDEIDPAWVDLIKRSQSLVFSGDEVKKRMDVVGEEGTSLTDFITYLKAEFLDAVYLQQNSFDPVDAAVNTERQQYTFRLLTEIIGAKLELADKPAARSYFYQLRQRFLDWNGAVWGSDSFKAIERDIRSSLSERQAHA